MIDLVNHYSLTVGHGEAWNDTEGAVTHAVVPDRDYTLCGAWIRDYAKHGGERIGRGRVHGVSCKRCRASLRAQGAEFEEDR